MALGHPGAQGMREQGESESKLRAQWLPVVNGVAPSGGSAARGQHGHQHPHPGLRSCLSLWWPRRGAAQCQAGLGGRAPSGLGAVTSTEQGWGWRSLPAGGSEGLCGHTVPTTTAQLCGYSTEAPLRKERLSVSSKTLFTDTEIGISCNFHVSWTIALLIFFNRLRR